MAKTVKLIPLPSTKLNPYAPPQSELASRSTSRSLESLSQDGPIRFSGRMVEEDLSSYLHQHEHLGCTFPLAWTMFAAYLVGLVIAIGGARLMPLAIGAFGLLVIGLAVSTTSYRRLVFKTSNPLWDRPLIGELRSEGVYVQRDSISTFYRWDWFVSAVICDRVVALASALPRHQSFIITESMVSDADTWSRLLEIVATIASDPFGRTIADKRAAVVRTMRDQNRARTIEPPSDASSFEGPLRMSDVMRAPRVARRLTRPLRAYVVRSTVVLSIGLIATGLVRLWLPDFGFWSVVIVAYLVAGIVWYLVLAKRAKDSDLIYHIRGFVSQTSVVTDFGVTTSEVPWSKMDLIHRTAESVTLRRHDSSQILYLSREMFADQTSWEASTAMLQKS